MPDALGPASAFSVIVAGRKKLDPGFGAVRETVGGSSTLIETGAEVA
jgi:hypothetical protein